MTEIGVQKQVSYMPGLDGLRALAVLAVIGYHLSLPFMPGGFLGVTLFFVLSGYLITDILLADDKIDLKGFYIRRVKRLLPGMVFMLSCLSAYVIVFNPGLLSNLGSALLPGLFFYSNWWFIWSGTPYFSTMSMPSLLNHFWSLAIEAQFYLIWPAALIALQRFIKKKWLRLALTALLAVLSAGLMAALYRPGADPSRVYYGTDTRIFSLLIGAGLAFVLPSRRIAKPVEKKTARALLDCGGLLALITIVLAAVYITQYDGILYLGGMLLFSLASLLLIAAAASPSTIVGRFFSLKPLKYIGTISYGIYLWQFPVIVISSAIAQSREINVWLSLGQVAATVLFAAFSHHFIEKPVRRSAILQSIRQGFFMTLPRKRWWKKAAALLVITAVLISVTGLLGARPAAEPIEEELRALPSALYIEPAAPTETTPSEIPDTSAEPSTSAPATPEGAGPSPSESPEPSAEVSPDTSAEPSGPPQDTAPPEIVASDLSVTLIGDSVGIDVTPYLKEYYPNIVVDAEVGRQFYQAKSIIEALLENDALAPTVIIELGSNGLVRESTLREIIDLIGSDRKIVFVNTQVPKSWCAGVNDMLTKICADYDNTIVADWYAASADKEEYFYSDGVHPNKTGSPVLAQLIVDAVNEIQDA